MVSVFEIYDACIWHFHLINIVFFLVQQQAIKAKKNMIVSVAVMDGRTVNLPVDSASTSKEVCQILANKIKLKDTFGFSLYVALYEKVHTLILFTSPL